MPLAVYVASLRGDVSFWDTADLQTVPYILGIPYPTGFPGYVLLGWVWSHALAVGTVAWRLNLLGAVATRRHGRGAGRVLLVAGRVAPIAFGAAAGVRVGGDAWAHATYVDVAPDRVLRASRGRAVFALRWARSGAWAMRAPPGSRPPSPLACDNTAC